MLKKPKTAIEQLYYLPTIIVFLLQVWQGLSFYFNGTDIPYSQFVGTIFIALLGNIVFVFFLKIWVNKQQASFNARRND